MIQLDVFTKMWNKKNGNAYSILSREVIDSTNTSESREMVLFTDGNRLFVREVKEFNEKFSIFPVPKEG